MQQVGAGPHFSPLAHDAPAALLASRFRPARSLGSRRRQPLRRHRRRRAVLAVMALVAGLSGGIAFTVLSGAAPALVTLPRVADLDRLASAAGLGLDEVSLTGHRFTGDLDVFDALDLANARSFLAFDSVAARERIERLPWVASAAITRVYPGRLEVRITERTPFALWRRGSRHHLIDQSGRVLGAVKPEDYASLPRVAGEGAAADAAGLIDLVGRYGPLKSRLVEAERIGERRWTLHLEGNVVIHLPADREVLALDEIAAAGSLDALAGGADHIVDLRSSRGITSRAAPAEATASSGPAGGS